MKILVLNCGSSSVKFQVFNMEKEETIAKGIVEEIGSDQAIVRYRPSGNSEYKDTMPVKNHEQALEWVINTLLHPEHGVIKDVSEIAGVGHRVVHGGEKFSGSVLITDEVIEKMEECSEFAPLHNPPNLTGIAAAKKRLSQSVQAGVFDTAFHHTLKKEVYLYGIPYEMYEKLGIRRYGFHGTSHYYVSHKAAEYMGKPIEDLKIVTCHLGNGASMAAVCHGKSIDTSMGFTPLEGLLMGTRSGDMDPYIPLYIMEKKGLSLEETSNFLNKKCGLRGVSGGVSDMREIEDGVMSGNKDQKMAFDMFCYRIRKYVGAYACAMSGLDAVVFTGGIGENSPMVRKQTMEGLSFMGIEMDDKKNETRGEREISTGKVKVLVIPTNEELVIARETKTIVEKIKAGTMGTGARA